MHHPVEYEVAFGGYVIGTVQAVLDINAWIDAYDDFDFSIDGVSMDDGSGKGNGPDMLTSDDPLIKAIGNWIKDKAEGDPAVIDAARDYAGDNDHDADDWYDSQRDRQWEDA